MAEVVGMPKLSDTMEEGGIANWLKNEGDEVAEGEPLVEIETDKATQEYEAPAEGVLLKIVAQPGKTYKLGEPIAVIGEAGEQVDLDALASSSPPPPSSPETGGNDTGDIRDTGDRGGAQVVELPLASSAPSAPPPSPAVTASGRPKSSPLARKMAQERGIDLTTIAGSGPAGRIVMRDVQKAPAASAAATAVVGGADERIPNSMMRKTIAKRLLAGKNEAPHFYLTVSADMERALQWRQRLNADLQDPTEKVSVNDLIVMASAKALLRHPVVNSSWQDDATLRYGSVHVCIAVALPEGLITPVVRNTAALGVRDIARLSKDLVSRGKAGNLDQSEYTGGTFTISNLGMFGIEEFTAIINPPQAAILAVGGTQAVPAVGEDGELCVQKRMKMTMSCDHRVVDGATGAQFLQTLVSYLEDPLMMLA